MIAISHDTEIIGDVWFFVKSRFVPALFLFWWLAK